MNVAMCARVVFPATTTRGVLELRQITSCKATTRISDICQRATLVLPRRITALRNKELRTFIRRNDPVIIELGYNGNLREEFRGYVSQVGAGIPVNIECRDDLFPVLQLPFNKSYENCHVPTLIREIIPAQFPVDVLDVTIGPQAFKKVTVGEALKYLSDEFGMYTFLKKGTVFCGKRFDANATTYIYKLEENVKADDLTYKNADEIRVKIEATSVKADGTRIKVEIGDEDGDIQKLSYFGIASESELRKLAEIDLEKFKFTGYEGTITGYGNPYAEMADYAELRSTQFPDRDATVLIEGVEKEFDKGYSRKLTLGGSI